MAPKKKKKPSANPARGFATTSLPSKPKHVVDDDTSTNTSVEAAQVPQSESVKGTMDEINNNPNSEVIEKMSAEQLEAYLEDNELQNLLDLNSVRCKSDAFRQTTKLMTEKRQLRAQSQNLSTYSWLPHDTIRDILELFRNDQLLPVKRAVNREQVDENKLLLDIWTLQQVLQALNFPRVDEAIGHVIDLAILNLLSPSTDTVLGLSDALDWYALNLDALDLPPYDGQAEVPQNDAERIDEPDILFPEASVNDQDSESDHTDPATHTEPESVSEGEDDDEPAALIDKYLRIKTALWKFDGLSGIPRATKKHPESRKTRILRDRLSAIERDILFDQYIADTAWNEIVDDLQADRARRFREAKNASNLPVRSMNGSDTVSLENDGMSSISSRTDKNVDDDDILFGSMFTSIDKPSVTDDQAVSSRDIQLLEVGKWTGPPPTTLLREMCKSIDSGFKMRLYPVTASSSHSARHKLEISWSRIIVFNRTAVSSIPTEANVSIGQKRLSLEMRSIAASRSIDSEAYIATLAIFLVSTSDESNLKMRTRLPTVWRDMLDDLVQKRKELTQNQDKDTLKHIRALIQEAEQRCHRYSRNHDTVLSSTEIATQLSSKHDRRLARQSLTPEELRKQWSGRHSRVSFQAMLEFRTQLPIYDYKEQILDAIEQNSITIICAETGSGKSTQTGSFILERQLSAGSDCHILITQPRRISAISLARRVSQELGEAKNDLGTSNSLIGYAIRMESRTSPATRLTFATTGVLLRMFGSSPTLDQLEYLILDEVHERTMELDLLFIALRQLQKQRPTLKIILMSATLNAKRFSDYFGGAPILNIPGRTFPVEIKFLEDAVEETNDLPNEIGLKSKPSLEDHNLADEDSVDDSATALGKLDAYSNVTRTRLSEMDQYRIDYELLTKIALAIATKPAYKKYSSAILIFMPGLAEIRRLNNILLSTSTFGNGWQIHLLHSSFSTEDLERAFARPPRGYRKVVIATNIAETGITIPDVTAVIDTCKEKVMRFVERRQLSKLTEGFISRASARQRSGRAARVQDGLCFHMVTRYRFEKLMLEQQIPEMLRLGLQDPILRVKVWNLGSIEDTLAAAIDPPSRKNVARAIEKLKDAGALTKSEELTPLGQQIAHLPLDVVLAKLAILGAIFGCLDPILTIIAILSSKSPFASSPSGQAQQNPRQNFSRAGSDLLSSLNAYQGWKKARVGRSGPEYCRKNHISDQNMVQIEDQKIQLLVYLVDAGVVNLDHEEKQEVNSFRGSRPSRNHFYEMPRKLNEEVSDDFLLCLVSMALYPRILVREGRGWRNIYTNQHVTLTSQSVNHASTKAPKWLSFFEAMQPKTGSPNVFETSHIPEVSLAVLLGSGVTRLFAGVSIIDNGRIRLAVKDWKEAFVIKILRQSLQRVLEQCYEQPANAQSMMGKQWIGFLQVVTGSQAAKGINSAAAGP